MPEALLDFLRDYLESEIAGLGLGPHRVAGPSVGQLPCDGRRGQRAGDGARSGPAATGPGASGAHGFQGSAATDTSGAAVDIEKTGLTGWTIGTCRKVFQSSAGRNVTAYPACVDEGRFGCGAPVRDGTGRPSARIAGRGAVDFAGAQQQQLRNWGERPEGA